MLSSLFKKYRKILIILSLAAALIYFAVGITFNKDFFAAHLSVDKTIEEPNAVQIKQWQCLMILQGAVFLLNALAMLLCKKLYWKVLNRNIIKNISMLMVTLTIFFFIFESLLQLNIISAGFDYDLRSTPNFTGYYNFPEEINSTYYRINSIGLRGDDYNLTNDTYRIICLGDSFTFGVGVSEEESFPALLEKKFSNDSKKVEVMNAGVGGFGTFEQGYQLNELMKYEPDLVLLNFYTNDYMDNYQRYKYYNHLMQNIFSYSRTYQFLLYGNYRKNLMLLNTMLYLKDTPEEHSDFWDLTFERVDEVHKIAAENNVRFAVAYLPAFEEADEERLKSWIEKYEVEKEDIDMNQPRDKLKAHAEKEGILFIDLLPQLRQQSRNTALYYLTDRHWNKNGHEAAAAEIYEKLINQGIIQN